MVNVIRRKSRKAEPYRQFIMQKKPVLNALFKPLFSARTQPSGYILIILDGHVPYAVCIIFTTSPAARQKARVQNHPLRHFICVRRSRAVRFYGALVKHYLQSHFSILPPITHSPTLSSFPKCVVRSFFRAFTPIR